MFTTEQAGAFIAGVPFGMMIVICYEIAVGIKSAMEMKRRGQVAPARTEDAVH